MNEKDRIEQIKTKMPNTYREIQAQAARMGNEAFALVRRGLRGEANCFYAFEAGFVVGTPFDITDIMQEMAWRMVQFGCAHVCIFPDPKGAADGTN